jgi:hypothetical protein
MAKARTRRTKCISDLDVRWFDTSQAAFEEIAGPRIADIKAALWRSELPIKMTDFHSIIGHVETLAHDLCDTIADLAVPNAPRIHARSK